MKMSTIFASLALLLMACNPLGDKVTLNAPSDVKVEQTGLETVRLTWNNTSTAYDGVIIPETSGEDNTYVIRAPITHQLKLKLKVMQKHLDDEPGPVIEGNFVKQPTR